MRAIVLRTGDAVAPVAARRGEFFSWIVREVSDAWAGEWEEVDVRGDTSLPDPKGAAAFIITGSSSSVTERAPWMLRLEAFVRQAVEAETPLFGICFGHQIVAQALGGHVARNPRGREIGTQHVRVTPHAVGHPLFARLGSAFVANHTHVDSVVRLPDGARLLAETDIEPHAAFALGAHVTCVQFHPEFDGDTMRGYIEARTPVLFAEGFNAGALLENASDTPEAGSMLRAFFEHVVTPHTTRQAAPMTSGLASIRR